MQLKIKRSQKDSMMGAPTFCLDARAEFTSEEQNSIKKYKLGNQVIYNSEAAKQHAASSQLRRTGDDYSNSDAVSKALGSVTNIATNSLMNLGHAALSRMSLNITINSLEKGQHIECKSLDEVLGAEQALTEACQNLKGYLQTAATFDGRESVLDFNAA